MDSLEGIFNDLGISQYLGVFVDQGFDTWETILDITESDLDALGVKLGHRRKLQRRIANHRGHAPVTSLVSPTRSSIEDPVISKPTQPEVKDAPVPVKRKYRRHPKPDENAPERPPSAYVLFSNKMRDDLKGQNLTFTEIAKLVGENWQNLDRSEKEPFESHAQELKERYNRDMNEYKKTSDYRRYCEYLQDFRKRQALHDKDAAKRVRVNGEHGYRGSVSSVSINPSATNSQTGSGSDSQHGSEPPPTRQQRLSSIASHSDVRMSPITATHEDLAYSPRSALAMDGNGSRSRPRGGSSPGTRDNLDQVTRRYPPIHDGHRSEGQTGFLPPISNPSEARLPMAPISHSPENGMPTTLPTSNQGGGSSTQSSASSKFWSRPPSLRTDQSTGSISSLSSFAQPRTPSESSLPIHALLSSKPATPTPQATTPAPEMLPMPQAASSRTHSYAGRPPDSQIDGRLPFLNGTYPSALPTQLPPMPPILSSPGPAQDHAAQVPLKPAMAQPGFDGMSALLRASDIVGRQNQ